MKKNNFTVLLIWGGLAGVVLGILFTASKVRANEPGYTPSNLPSASVVYDEKWKATEVCYATSTGYTCADASSASVVTAGQLDSKNGVPYVVYHPKVKVSRWHVYGHMHFSR